MQRLGKNHGRYNGEAIDIDAVLGEIHDSALAHGWTAELFLNEPGMRLHAYERLRHPAAPNLYLATGIHGDEPSGPLAVLELLRENTWPEANLRLVPCTNPTGFRANTRENYQGLDLNRQYRNPVAREIAAHIAWLQTKPRCQLSLLLHEDWEANGFYIYELNPNNRLSLAQPIIEAVSKYCPIETAAKVDDFDCNAGIIRPPILPADRPLWAEALYMIARQSEQSYTFESPSDFPLALRVQAHLAATREALRLLPILSEARSE